MRFGYWAARAAALAFVLGGLSIVAGDQAKVPGTPLPVEAASVYQTGMATWYGPGYEGSRTACGGIYRSAELTAASNILPCGSVVTVTNLDTDAAVSVTITDRGAFGPPIIIDLSMAAFSTIGHLDQGMLRVTVTQ
jgi:rare lipoprotein A